jgi:transcription-repair coupling factor (superfamily II helicase)
VSLRSLLSLLGGDPTMARALEGGEPVLAVPQVATSYVSAGLGTLGTRKPLVVITPTAVDAERLWHDLRAFTSAEEVELFPAWDTLPFERVSPEVQTMGHRLRVLWRLGATARFADYGDDGSYAPPEPVAPAMVVAPMRAVLQIIPETLGVSRPVCVSKGDRIDQKDLVARLVSMGYRREYQVEHVGEVAVRGGIIDVFPSTGELPVRIDLWGDEVDRLTTFEPGDQRSVEPLERTVVFGCRELVPTEAVRARARQLVHDEPWGRAHWERLADGQWFDGMESWLPWLAEDPVVLPDLLDVDSQIILVEPRRARDRSTELSDDEAALAQALAETWGAVPDGESSVDPESGSPFPRLHVSFDRLFARCKAPVTSFVSVSDGPDTPEISARGWPPAHGDRALLASQLGRLVEDGFSVTICVGADGAAHRMVEMLAVRRRLRGSGEAGAAGGGLGSRPGIRGSWRSGRSDHRAGHDGATACPQGAQGSCTSDRRLLRRSVDRRLRRSPPAWRGALRWHGDANGERCFA